MKNILFFTLLEVATCLEAKAQANAYSRPPVAPPFQNNYQSQYVPLPTDAIEQALRAKQADYNRALEDCKNQAAELYNAKESAPEIEDGRHKITLIGRMICSEAIAIVKNGRIASILLGNGNSLTDFTISTPIDKCYSKIGYPNKETGATIYLEVIFLEDLYK